MKLLITLITVATLVGCSQPNWVVIDTTQINNKKVLIMKNGNQYGWAYDSSSSIVNDCWVGGGKYHLSDNSGKTLLKEMK